MCEVKDDSHEMERTEVVWGRCDSHLGLIFDDGQKPTGLSYHVNSASLKLVKRECQ